MMKSLLAAAIVILGLTIFVAVQDERATQHHAQNAAQSNKTVTSTKSNEENSDNGIYDPKGDTPSLYGFFRWPGGITTWAILLTLLAIVDQTRHVARAAEATEKAVKANLLNVEALMNAERAWTLIDTIGNPPNGLIDRDQPQLVPGIVLRFKVYGKRP